MLTGDEAILPPYPPNKTAAHLDGLLSFIRENIDTLTAYAGVPPKQVLADLILALGEEETQ